MWLEVHCEFGKLFEIDIGFSAAQLPVSRIRAPHANGHHSRSPSHLNVFRTIADVAALGTRNLQTTHRCLQTLGMWFLLLHLFIADDRLEKRFETQLLNLTCHAAVAAT